MARNVVNALGPANFFKTVELTSASAETTVWAPSGKRFRWMGFLLIAGATGTLTFKDGTGGTSIFVVGAVASVPMNVNLGNGILSGAADRALTVTRPGSGTLIGTIWGREE